MPRLLLAGETKLLLDLLRHEGERRGLEVVGDVAQIDELPSAIDDLAPDVVIIEAPEAEDWIDLVPDLKRFGAAVTVVTDSSSPEHLVELLSAGISGVFRSETSTTAVVDGALKVLAGGAALHHDVAALVLHQWRSLRESGAVGGNSPRADLTPREQDVLVAMAEGLPTKSIARQLGVALKTVENHKTRVYQKLGARSNAHAISIAIRLGVLQPTSGSRSA